MADASFESNKIIENWSKKVQKEIDSQIVEGVIAKSDSGGDITLGGLDGLDN